MPRRVGLNLILHLYYIIHLFEYYKTVFRLKNGAGRGVGVSKKDECTRSNVQTFLFV